jgi:uncharacterized protein YjbI with pentapeptide repeats
MTEATDTGLVRCLVEMKGDVCGRPIYQASEHDIEPVCLMHSQAPQKSDVEFQAEFERILSKAEEDKSIADFTRFQFPSSDYYGRTFSVACCFSHATFAQDARFNGTTFTQEVKFIDATFELEAIFWLATFMQAPLFGGATFTKKAYFDGARFEQGANFYGATFVFEATFDAVMFAQQAEFGAVTFSQGAYFGAATFAQGATFYDATFTLDSYFGSATFTGHADFEETKFLLSANFRNASFGDTASFRETSFRTDATMEPGLWFNEVKLEHPERIEFYKTDLSRALFYNTDVSKINLTLVRYRERGKRFSLFEEVIDIEEFADLAPIANSSDERNYSLIAETYHQLKRNFDAKGDFWTAGHFHYGEMEMLRLHSRLRVKSLRWLAHNFSLTALYKHGSSYGESMKKPLAWLAAMILLFALLFPLPSLEVNPQAGEPGLAGWQVNYWNARQFFQEHDRENPVPRWMRQMTGGHAALPLLVHSGMTALSVAGFQKELRYSPAYPWGRAMAMLELLLTTTLGGLFLLAIRRQYKRS